MTFCKDDIRKATTDDILFLRAMLYEAAYWRPGAARPPIEEALNHPELAKLLADWGREGDTGVIAEGCDDSERWGAAWYRFWTQNNHSYGFISSEIPELAIGVVPDRRGEGIGRILLSSLIETARADGLAALSLSVEVDNPALRLYESLNFRKVKRVEGAWTMKLDLR